MVHSCSTLVVMMLLCSLALFLPPQNLRLLVLDRLVNLSPPRRLVPVHLGRQGRILLAGYLLQRLLLAATAVGVVVVQQLVLGIGRKAVGYAALILCR